MEGGTTFFFVTDGIESALEQAKQAAPLKRASKGFARFSDLLTTHHQDRG